MNRVFDTLPSVLNDVHARKAKRYACIFVLVKHIPHEPLQGAREFYVGEGAYDERTAACGNRKISRSKNVFELFLDLPPLRLFNGVG